MRKIKCGKTITYERDPFSKGNGWDVITEKAKELTARHLDHVNEVFIKAHPQYAAIIANAEVEFWRAFSYGMSTYARDAGEKAARATGASFSKSLETLIKRTVTDHFAASDGLAELEAEMK